MDAVVEVKSRLNIEDIVSEYVQLKRAGRNYKGLSPFTNEKTPSFIVSPEKQIWHDFSSGRGGDVISFIQEVEGLDFKRSLELLARKAGVDLSTFSRQSSGDGKLKERLFQVVESAVTYYQVQLTKHEIPLKYVRQIRGYDKQTILDFKFGYAPMGARNLTDYLLKKGFSEEELTKTGLSVTRRGELVDMFRDRLMIPLTDEQGRAVGFTARLLKKDDSAPKYINTPATILYDKGRQLFGFAMAKEYIRKSGYVVVVEGNLDVVASHQAGVKQVVASAGTALTTYHLKTLQRFTGDVRLAFDDDRAGQEAAERTIPLAQELGIELSFIKIPSGKDPDELIKQDVKLWQETVEAPEYMVDWLIDRAASEVDLQTAQGKRQFTSKVLAIIRHIKDNVEAEHYIRKIAEMTKTSIESVNKKYEQDASSQTVRLKKPKVEPQDLPADTDQIIREQHFLAIVLAVPDLRNALEQLPEELFSVRAREFLKESENMQKVQHFDEYAKMLTLLFEESYQHTNHDELSYQLKQLMVRLVEQYTRHAKNNILKQLETADEHEEKHLLAEVHALEQLKKNIRSS